jgi:outer membrane protein assembly factor BamD (BamD/ComL family)
VSAQISDQTRMLAEIDERTREAWALYSESLRDLQGSDYEEAERESWDRLQRELEELAGERALVAGA